MVFLVYTYFGSNKQIPEKSLDTAEILEATPAASPRATPQSPIPASSSPTANESSDESYALVVPEDSLYSPEKIAERKKNSLNLCAYLDGKTEKTENFERMLNGPRTAEDSTEKTIRLRHKMSLTFFQVDLPVIAKFYVERESGKLHNKAEIALHYDERSYELQNNYRRAEVILRRSYYTLIFARAAALKPELLRDPEMAAMCKRLESIDTPMSRQELNNLVYGYLERVQLQASDVKFNPMYEPFLEVRIGPDGPFYYTGNDKDL